MTKEDVKIILKILGESYGLDGLDLIEFIMHYEKESGNKIPDEWVVLPR